MGSILVLLLFALPILIVVFIVSLLIKSKDQESFEEKIRVIYMYTVIIVSLIMMVGGVISLFSSGLSLIFPDDFDNTNRIVVSMITSATIVFISLPLFMYHNKKVKLD